MAGGREGTAAHASLHHIITAHKSDSNTHPARALPHAAQDVVAYLRLAVSLRDDVALARVINTPRRGLGDTSVERLQACAAERGQTLAAFLFGGGESSTAGTAGAALPPLPDRKELGLTPKAAAALEALRELIAELHAAAGSLPLGQALEAIIQRVRSAVLRGWATVNPGLTGSPVPLGLALFTPDRVRRARQGGRLQQRAGQGGGRAGAPDAPAPAGAPLALAAALHSFACLGAGFPSRHATHCFTHTPVDLRCRWRWLLTTSPGSCRGRLHLMLPSF